MKATEFDKKFDAGEDVSGAIDWSQARRPNDQPKRVNVDFPAWVVEDRRTAPVGSSTLAVGACGSPTPWPDDSFEPFLTNAAERLDGRFGGPAA